MIKHDKASVKIINQHGPTGFVMFVAFIGAFIYFLQNIHNFWDVVFAFLEAIVWPGIVVFHVLQTLGA